MAIRKTTEIHLNFLKKIKFKKKSDDLLKIMKYRGIHKLVPETKLANSGDHESEITKCGDPLYRAFGIITDSLYFYPLFEDPLSLRKFFPGWYSRMVCNQLSWLHGSKNLVQTKKKIQFIKLEISNSIMSKIDCRLIGGLDYFIPTLAVKSV